jgi:two-component system response regulator NreC
VESVGAAEPREPLTPREERVLEMSAYGYTSDEIARSLSLSSRTVDSVRARLMQRLGLSSRAELVRYALKRGLMAES